MSDDERAIRNLITTWHRASEEGDVAQVLTLMSEDVIFLTPGQPPIRGRDEFAALQKAAGDRFRLTAQGKLEEVVVRGDWAYCWTHLTVTMTPRAGGAPIRRAGHTLSILRKDAGGNWVLTRDANMLAVEKA
ncbi:MAG TPA: SgcJ/EcaC family oxidoreductase [Gemmatimonadaceae bacterium]|nr:SgcJ/EcaC family oxidoreductase [Gemmatimonadaceae bacterium]